MTAATVETPTGQRDPKFRVVRFCHGGPMGLLPAAKCAAGCGHLIEPKEKGGRIGGVEGTACAGCCDRFETGEPVGRLRTVDVISPAETGAPVPAVGDIGSVVKLPAEPDNEPADTPPLDLRPFATDATNWGANPETTLADLVEAVRLGILAGDIRGRQKEIGPSEIGHPCARWIAYRLAGTKPTGTEPTPWRQRVGTLIHADVDDHAHRDNETRGTRWLTGLKVTVGELYPGRSITGTLDVFDIATGTVIDVKCPGATAMRTYGPGKPESEQYRVQLQGYGRGVMQAGFLPAWVATLRLSPARELSEYVGKPERFDASIAETALARVGGIARMVDQLGERAAALLPPTAAYCHRCPWFQPNSTDLTAGCPGAPGAATATRRASVDDLVG